MENINYSKFYDISYNSMLILDVDGNFLSVNKQFLKITGFNKDEVIGKHFSSFIFELDLDISIKEFSEVLIGKKTSSFIVRLKKKNDKLIYIEFTASLDNDSKLIYAVGKDITGHLFKDTYLQETALGIPGSIFKLKKTNDGHFEFEFINNTFSGIFQNAKDDRFVSFLEILSTESQLTLLKVLEEIQIDFKFKSFRINLKELPDEFYQINLNPLRDRNDLYFYGICTTLEKNHIELENVEFSRLYENNNIGFFIISFSNYNIKSEFEEQFNAYLDGIITDCNDLFAMTFGFNSKEDIIGKTVKELNTDPNETKLYLKNIIDNNFSFFSNINYQKFNDAYITSNLSSLINNDKLIEIKDSFENVTETIFRQKKLDIAHNNYKTFSIIVL